MISDNTFRKYFKKALVYNLFFLDFSGASNKHISSKTYYDETKNFIPIKVRSNGFLFDNHIAN